MVMLVPLAVLAVSATFAGTAFRHLFIGGGYESFGANRCSLVRRIIFSRTWSACLHSSRCRRASSCWAGSSSPYYMYIIDRTAPQRLAADFPALYRFLLNKWYFDELYDFLFVRPAFAIGRLFWKGGDGVIIDGFRTGRRIGARPRRRPSARCGLQTGYVYHYAFAMLLGAAALTTWYLFGGVTR